MTEHVFLDRLLDLTLEDDPDRFFSFCSLSVGGGVFIFGARSRVVSLEQDTGAGVDFDSDSDDPFFRRSFLGVMLVAEACLDCRSFSPCFFLLWEESDLIPLSDDLFL